MPWHVAIRDVAEIDLDCGTHTGATFGLALIVADAWMSSTLKVSPDARDLLSEQCGSPADSELGKNTCDRSMRLCVRLMDILFTYQSTAAKTH